MMEWNEESDAPRLESVTIFGVAVKTGDSRAACGRRRPPTSWTWRCKGKVAIVEAIERDFEDRVHLAVVLEDDPGRDFGMLRQPGHRFFFAPEEVEPLALNRLRCRMNGKVLVAGIGNIFLGDDAFGVEVAQRLAARPLPEGVKRRRFWHSQL